MRRLAPIALATLLAIAMLVGANHDACSSNGYPALGIIEVGDGTAEHTFYIDDRNYLFGNGLWLWEESNGIFFGGDPERDLQRGNSCPNLCPDYIDECIDDPFVVPDRIIL